MRLNIYFKIKTIMFLLMASSTQKIMGINSTVKGSIDTHFIFWDMDDCTLKECMEELYRIKQMYHIKTKIQITSDKEGSYRAFCLEPKSFREMFQIIVNTRYVDWLFIRYTALRRKATLRTSNKQGRIPNKIVGVIGGDPELIPPIMERVIYETGTTKEALNIISVVKE